jgi:hypothetical protein
MFTRERFFSGILKLAYSFLLPALLVITAGCGKKGLPTMKSFEKPVAPSSLAAIHREDEIYLLWNYPKDKEITVRNFVVLRSSGSDFKRIAEAENNKRFFSDNDIRTGTSYTYKVLAQNHRGTLSNDSNIITVKPEAVPLPPHAIEFKATDNSIQLKWQGQSEGTFFNVYKSREKGIYGLLPVNKAPLTDKFFSDQFDLKQTVYYTVRSLTDVSLRNESQASPELAVDPLEFIPSQPAGLRWFLSSESVFLSWNGPEEAWVTGFRIYKKTRGGEYKLEAETQIPAYIDHDKSEGERDYRINAVGPSREGPGTEITGIILYRDR